MGSLGSPHGKDVYLSARGLALPLPPPDASPPCTHASAAGVFHCPT